MSVSWIKKNKARDGIDEAHSEGTKIYKNSIINLEGKLQQIRKECNYHLFAVRLVMKILQTLYNGEVKMLELCYGMNYR